MDIPFSPPFIGEEEIAEVVDTLRSGWITTGPKTKIFENNISAYCNTDRTVCLNSATAALELTLRYLGIGEGDEVIVPAYTYTASASVVCHVGAKLVFIDSQKDDYFMDLNALENAVTEKTKAIIPVDIAGIPSDYDKIFDIIHRKNNLFRPNSEVQKTLGRIALVCDGSHSLGSVYKGKKACTYPDFTVFSFHAVKNLTTAEGGAVTWKDFDGIDSDEIYKQFQLMSLHGQSKDALSKIQRGAWEYDVIGPMYKFNMTDITASIGIRQLEKYDTFVAKRMKIAEQYTEALSQLDIVPHIHQKDYYRGNGHLYMLRFKKNDVNYRNEFIKRMADKGIACNVHYKPLPMLTAYKNLGFDINDYPNAYNLYINEITLPIFYALTEEQVKYIIDSFKDVTEEMECC